MAQSLLKQFFKTTEVQDTWSVSTKLKRDFLEMERCSFCRKILFRKKDGSLACPNACEQSTQRKAFNTVIDPRKDRRLKETFDPWINVKY